MSKIVMYCIFAKESVKKMNGNRGKLASMAGHAYLHSYWDAIHSVILDCGGANAHTPANWGAAMQALAYQNTEKAYKITLVVETIEELVTLQTAYKDICGTSLVTDAGVTVFGEPTTVCLGIGPIEEENVGEDLKALKVFI